MGVVFMDGLHLGATAADSTCLERQSGRHALSAAPTSKTSACEASLICNADIHIALEQKVAISD